MLTHCVLPHQVCRSVLTLCWRLKASTSHLQVLWSGLRVRAAALSGFGARMLFPACVSSCALQASLLIESVMSEADIFVSSKRNFNILHHMVELKNNAFSRSSKIRPLKTVSSSPFGAYFDNEIDLADSGSLEGMKVATSSFRASFKPSCEACPSLLRTSNF